MPQMTYRQQIELAHELGAKYIVGRWKFPSNEAADTFRRRVSGVEWTEAQRQTADAALIEQRKILFPDAHTYTV